MSLCQHAVEHARGRHQEKDGEGGSEGAIRYGICDERYAGPAQYRSRKKGDERPQTDIADTPPRPARGSQATSQERKRARLMKRVKKN